MKIVFICNINYLFITTLDRHLITTAGTAHHMFISDLTSGSLCAAIGDRIKMELSLCEFNRNRKVAKKLLVCLCLLMSEKDPFGVCNDRYTSVKHTSHH